MSMTAEIAIRIARADFNRALRDADLDKIGIVLAPYAILVAGTDSAQIVGRKAQLQAWKREFAADERTTYIRTPDTVLVSPVEPIAFEHGSWQGVAAKTGETQASGAYSAKWRQSAGSWLIEAEIYLTLC